MSAGVFFFWNFLWPTATAATAAVAAEETRFFTFFRFTMRNRLAYKTLIRSVVGPCGAGGKSVGQQTDRNVHNDIRTIHYRSDRVECGQ
uniref:Putative secreted protein n=1 Tax=Anopheles marajoara TaxID=58244 RepID=A0A2M4CAE9_9DIPT